MLKLFCRYIFLLFSPLLLFSQIQENKFHVQADSLKNSYQYNLAIESYLKAAEIYISKKEPKALALIYSEIGDTYSELSDSKNAN
jgi:hypothetical protein